MRIAFAGTPPFAGVALEAILREGIEIAFVLTQPDRPAGRGLALQQSAVKEIAGRHGIRVLQPVSLRTAEARAEFLDEPVDALVVAAYGLILPQEVLDWPRWGCLNIHASLLPRWRGAAPIQRALLAGDRETGVCIMQMEAGLDTGPVLRREATHIEAEDNAGRLHDRLAAMGARLIVEVLRELGAGRALAPQVQPLEGVTYASKIVAADTQIDWQKPAVEIERLLRAMQPSPGARTMLGGQNIKIWRGHVDAGSAAPGRVVAGANGVLQVGCGEGLLRVLELQAAGGRRMTAQAFLAGRTLDPDAHFA